MCKPIISTSAIDRIESELGDDDVGSVEDDKNEVLRVIKEEKTAARTLACQ